MPSNTVDLLTIVASVCGTGDDLQDYDMQFELLHKAGVIAFPTNAKASLFCVSLFNEGGK